MEEPPLPPPPPPLHPPPPPPPLATRASQEQNSESLSLSQRPALQGAGYSSSVDAEVVEIPSQLPLSTKPPKQNEAFVQEVINVDKAEDNADSAINVKEPDNIKKGKAVMDVSDGHLNGDSGESLAEYKFIPGLIGAINGTESNGLEEGSHTSFNGDEQNYDVAPYDSDYMDYILEDAVHHDDDYDLLQADFDSINIPSGVEAFVPWFPVTSKNEKKSDAGNNVDSSGSPLAGTAGFLKETESFGLTGPVPVEKNTISGISGSNGQANSASHPSQVNLSTPWLSLQSMQNKKNQAGSQQKGSDKKFSSGLESSKSPIFLESFKNKKLPVSSSSTTNFNSLSQLAGAHCPYGVDPFNWHQSMPHGLEKHTVSSTSSYPSFPLSVSGSSSYPSFPLKIISQNNDATVHPPKTWLKDSTQYPMSFAPPANFSSYIRPFAPSVYTLPEEDGDSQLPQNSSGDHANDINNVLRRFENFKHFDTVQDHSDHHYSKYDSAVKQPSKSWTKRIQEEWKILEKDLPDNIFVRVYETRIDLLRAVIVGAEGTPYHDGLYFFDMFFPPGYPQSPPHVYYHSRGLRLNPNLYNSGKVCLSLLNTWTGNENEKWMPFVSTVLQLLVSIQGLILNAKPYFNEPGLECTQGTASGEKMSLKYNEDTFLLSLRTMTYVIKTPPKHFEDFVMGHFFKRAQDILSACKAYLEGAQVGCLMEGGEQDVDAGGEESRSSQFKQTLAGYIGILARAFTKIGVKDCEELLTPPPPTAAKETETQAEGVTDNQASSLG